MIKRGKKFEEKITECLIHGVTTGNNRGRGAIKAQLSKGRYPFAYPRDGVRVAMALDAMGEHSKAEAYYQFLKRVQFKSGEWVQRYDLNGEPQISRPSETDTVAMGIAGICDHYWRTGSKKFLKDLWPSILLALNYLRKMRRQNGLIYGKHSIHENREAEEGFEIWTNSWACRAFRDAATLAQELNEKTLAQRWKKDYTALYSTIMKKMWNGTHFVKTIQPNKQIITAKDISSISPAWAGILPYTDPKIKNSIKHISSLWDAKIGGYQRYNKMEVIKDWHWHDGGHGPWLTYTIVMAQAHHALRQRKKERACVEWVHQVYTKFREFPEHISLFTEFAEWKHHEWRIGTELTPWVVKETKMSEQHKKQWQWQGKNHSVVPWGSHLLWPYAEYILHRQVLGN